MLVVTSLTRSIRYIDKIRTLVGAGMAGSKSVLGAVRVVTSLTRSIRYIDKIRTFVGAGMAGSKSVQGAMRIVTSLTRSVTLHLPSLSS